MAKVAGIGRVMMAARTDMHSDTQQGLLDV